MNFRIIFSILLLLCIGKLYSQINSQDSILLDIYLEKAGKEFSNTDSLVFYLPKAFKLLKKDKQYERYTAWLNAFSIHYNRKHKYQDFRKRSEFAVEECKKYLNPNHSNTGDALNNLGLSYRIEGRNEKSIIYYQEAQKIYLQNNIQANNFIALLQNMSVPYRNKGDYDQGIQILNQALLVHKDSVGKPDLTLARIHLNLGHLYRDKGEFEEAKKKL